MVLLLTTQQEKQQHQEQPRRCTLQVGGCLKALKGVKRVRFAGALFASMCSNAAAAVVCSKSHCTTAQHTVTQHRTAQAAVLPRDVKMFRGCAAGAPDF